MSSAVRILIVDEDRPARRALTAVLRANGYAVDAVDHSLDALRRLDDFHPEVVLVSAELAGMTVRTFLTEVIAHLPDCLVIVSARDPHGALAVEAMQDGAADCVAAPVCVRRLSIVLRRELERQRLRIEVRMLRARLGSKSMSSLLAPAAPAVPGTSLDAVEKFVILCTLEHTAGSTTRAARILGISARKIQYKLLEYKAA